MPRAPTTPATPATPATPPATPTAHSLPRQVLTAAQAWPLFDIAGTRAIESRELALQPGGALMQRAGLSVARMALAMWPHARHIGIAAGPGGNGGDGLVAAAHLRQAGRDVTVTLVADPARLGAQAAALARAQQAGVRIAGAWPQTPFDGVIDALLGIGARSGASGALHALAQHLNSGAAPCLAVDLPSGLNANTGTADGQATVRAQATLALLTLKPGLFTAHGRDHAGALWFDALGAEPAGEAPAARLTSRADWHAASPLRLHAQHKGSFGDVLIIGGAPGMHGAARLAASAAMAAGAGRTILSLLDTNAAPGDSNRPECLWSASAWTNGAAALEASAVVCGCGGGSAVHAALPAVLARSARLVLDADALNAIAGDVALQALLLARAASGLATVMTPHPLEAARLLNITTAQVQADRLAAAAALVARFNATVALKGSGTVIAAPGSIPAINSTGNASLATGGTGDVLAGWIGGLWAGQASTALQGAGACAARCATAAVWLHGLAADQAAVASVRALDLVEAMRNAAVTAAD